MREGPHPPLPPGWASCGGWSGSPAADRDGRMSMLGGGALFSQSTQPLLESAPLCAPRALMEVVPQGSHRSATWLTRGGIDSPNVLLTCVGSSNPVVEGSTSVRIPLISSSQPPSRHYAKMAPPLATAARYPDLRDRSPRLAEKRRDFVI